MFKNINHILILISLLYYLIDCDNAWKEKICQDKSVNDEKMIQFQKELQNCYQEKDCIELADDVDLGVFQNLKNKYTYAGYCSNKYAECNKERQEQYKKMRNQTQEERLQLAKDRQIKIMVCSMVIIFNRQLFFIFTFP